MSTLTSVDMNIDRSSTRLHAPPGGQSSICFGTYGLDEPVNKPTHRASTNNIYGNNDIAEVVKTAPRASANNIYGTDQTNEVVKSARRPSANNIYGSEETEAELEQKRLAARRPSNSQGMSNIMSHDENEPPTTARRVRQAPGGTSSLTLG